MIHQRGVCSSWQSEWHWCDSELPALKQGFVVAWVKRVSEVRIESFVGQEKTAQCGTTVKLQWGNRESIISVSCQHIKHRNWIWYIWYMTQISHYRKFYLKLISEIAAVSQLLHVNLCSLFWDSFLYKNVMLYQSCGNVFKEFLQL